MVKDGLCVGANMNQILKWVVALMIGACAMVFIDELMSLSGSDSASLSQTPQIERVEFIGDAGDSTTARSQSILEEIAQSKPNGETQATPSGGAQTMSTDDSASIETVVPQQPGQLLDADLWGTRMSLPSADAVASFVAPNRSPYIVCDPQFGIDGIVEFAVDFKADSQPRGTYLSVCNLDLDLSVLNGQYSNVHRDYSGVAAYAGFQVLDDGSKVAIMSVWDTYVTDPSGTESIIHAVRTHPDTYRVSKPFEGEGSGIQTIVDYDWQQGHAYRALIQCVQTDGGSCELIFSVMDLESGRWDKLVSYDLGYGNTYMTRTVCFLEDYLVEEAAEVRTMELWNFRASTGGGSWVPAYSATMCQNYEYPGSYNYGSDGARFWAITSAIPGLCSHPADGEQFSVTDVEGGAPY